MRACLFLDRGPSFEIELWFVLWVLWFADLCHSVNLRDEIVKCYPQTMQITFNFGEPFYGVLYAERFYNTQACRTVGNGERSLTITIPRNIESSEGTYCGVRTNKGRNEFHVSLILSETEDILVEGMRTFDILCRYVIEDFTVSLSAIGALNIRAPNEQQDSPTIVRGVGKAVLPSLDMAVRRGHGIDGPKIEAAVIGEKITLDLSLADSTGYDLRVYNCIAHDGSRTASGGIEIVDSDGCVKYIEKVIESSLKELIDRSGKHIYADMYGFQFSTSDLVYFECQVKPCLGQCNFSQCNRTVNGQGLKHFGNLERVEYLRQYDSKQSENINVLTKLRVQPSFYAEKLLSSSQQLDSPIQAESNSTTKDDGLSLRKEIGIGILASFVVVSAIAVGGYFAFKSWTTRNKLMSSSNSCTYSHYSVTS